MQSARDEKAAVPGRSHLMRDILTGIGAGAVFACLLVVVVLPDGPAPGWDRAVRDWVLAHRTQVLTDVAVSMSLSGTALAATVLVSGAGLLLTNGTVAQRARITVWCAAAIVIPSLVRLALSAAVGRGRPLRAQWLTDAHGLAFPSGHATNSTIAAGLLTWIAASRLDGKAAQRVAGLVAVAWAAGVGWSRVYLGVHWPSDVLGGWCLAITWLAVLQVLGFPRDHRSHGVQAVGSFRWWRGRGRGCRGAG
jgi:membrane-associated phospholipid phosphatase